MKRLFLFFGIVAMALTSCSSDDTDYSTLLLKKRITHLIDGSTKTSDYTYTGSKLVSVVDSDGDYANYTYTDDLITSIKFYDTHQLYQENFYTYNSSGQLVELVMVGHGAGWGQREVYVYNTNGSITTMQYSGDTISQTDLHQTESMTLLANGEIGSLTDGDYTFVFTYDAMNSELKNATGYSKISFTLSRFPQGSNHNLTSMSNEYGYVNFTKTYTYNAGGYPVTSSTQESGLIYDTSEYFYE